MTENGEPLRLLDEAIELEKREAIEYLRARPGGLRLVEGLETRAPAPPFAFVWAVPLAASAVFALSLLFMALGPSWGNPEAPAIQADRVHERLVSFRQINSNTDPPCLVDECRAVSDREWQIQAAIYRIRRPASGNIEALIVRAFSGGASATSAPAPLARDVVETLGRRIQEAKVEQALIRWRTRQQGS